MLEKVLEVSLYSKYFWIAVVLLYVYLKFVVYSYWKRQGVPYETPRMPFSNALPLALGQISLGNHFKGIYNKFKKYRFNGFYMFHQPVLMINDPQLIKTILIKEFNQFRDRGMYHNETVDPLTNNLAFLPSEKWRKLRAKLTPTFTSSKLKEMFPLIEEITDELIMTCDKTLAESNIIDMKDLMSRYTVDTICSIAFGFNCKSLENPINDFRHYGEMAFNLPPAKNALAMFATIILDIFRIPVFPAEMTHFFSTTFEDMVKFRRQNNVGRKDLINLLMQLMDGEVLDDEVNKRRVSDEEKLTMIEAQAQAFVYFLGGFETSSSAMSYLLYELALNSKVQENIHNEVDEFFNKGPVTYDRIKKELPYLDMAFSEVLRKHPSVPFVTRVCMEDWQIPDSEVKIKKGTGILMSVSGIHSDPDIYPEPEKFDPTRFTESNIATRSPYVYLPFGHGPRVCIGAKFAELQSKVALLSFLYRYKLYTCEKTLIPIEYSKRSFAQTPGSEVYLRVEKRKHSLTSSMSEEKE